jgi:hypothetical protein
VVGFSILDARFSIGCFPESKSEHPKSKISHSLTLAATAGNFPKNSTPTLSAGLRHSPSAFIVYCSLFARHPVILFPDPLCLTPPPRS